MNLAVAQLEMNFLDDSCPIREEPKGWRWPDGGWAFRIAVAQSGMSLVVAQLEMNLPVGSYPISDELERAWRQMLVLSFSSGSFPPRNTQIEDS